MYNGSWKNEQVKLYMLLNMSFRKTMQFTFTKTNCSTLEYFKNYHEFSTKHCWYRYFMSMYNRRYNNTQLGLNILLLDN